MLRARPWWALELDGLRYQEHRQHRHEGLLSGLLPRPGRRQGLIRVFQTPNRMIRVAINDPLPEDIGTGFAVVQEWEFADCHPVIPAWFGKHFATTGWAPSQLLAFLTGSGLLQTLKIREAFVAFEKQTEVWLPEDRDQRCSIIDKFTQGGMVDGKKCPDGW